MYVRPGAHCDVADTATNILAPLTTVPASSDGSHTGLRKLVFSGFWLPSHLIESMPSPPLSVQLVIAVGMRHPVNRAAINIFNIFFIDDFFLVC
jgi:hypothetical protein